MSGRHEPKIIFPGHSKWIAASQDGMAMLASRMDIEPLAMRVLFAAMSRCNGMGHAPFDAGELRSILSKLDLTTGEVLPVSNRTLTKALRSAERLGLVLHGSHARCVILAPSLFQRAERGNTQCAHDRMTA